jgi:bacterioferritin-associated ferredoxin
LPTVGIAVPVDHPMIVCLCNGLRERACAELAGAGACRGIGCLYRLQNARVRCGRCVPIMRELLERHAPATGDGRVKGGEPAVA